MSMAIIGSSLVALSCGILPYVAGDYYWSGLGRLEADIRDKLRQLRVSSKKSAALAGRVVDVCRDGVSDDDGCLCLIFRLGLITAALLGGLAVADSQDHGGKTSAAD